MARYRSAPAPIQHMPPGIPYIVGNEAAERYSFYGMRAILVVFMTTYLLNAQGELDPMGDVEARGWFHLFVSAVYLFPFLGAIIADAFLGKYRTIIVLSIVYCLGHLALALDETRLGLFVGLSLIAIGSGGIKPCVSAHVGDQFGASNQHLLSKVYSWFYFAINAGALVSMLLGEWLLRRFGAGIAFGIPGLLMFIATLIFWMGRHKFVHIPPGGRAFLRETLSGEGLRALLKLGTLYVFIAMFWALFDQQGSAWVQQAMRMDRQLIIEWGPAQFQWLNAALILAFIPLFNRVIYPAINRVFRLTALRKISIGMFVAASAFIVPAWLEMRLDAGENINIAWQIVGYVLITAAEIMISITALEFSYTQAPKKMKSLVMGAYLSSVALGNLFTSAVNFFIENEDGSAKISGASYYAFFAAMMLMTALIFIPIARAFKERTYIQEEEA